MFVSIMPFLFNIDDTKTFAKLTEDLSFDQKKMYRHLKYPYHEILNQIRSEHDFSGNLYDIVFSYQNADIPNFCKWLPNYEQPESLQIHIKNLNENKKALSVHYDYLTDIFSENDIEYMHSRISNMISQVLENENILVSDFEIVNKSEKKFLLNDFNKKKSSYPNNSNIVKEFEKIVKKYPNNIAVSSNSESLTYAELNNKANILAQKIIELNIKTDIIAFALKRNVSIYVAILGILKSGHTYMPIDPDYPIDRVNFMLENSKTKILISTESFLESIDFAESFIDIEKIDFNIPNVKNLEIPIESDHLAYIMYTSGSTGIPKAVAIRHYNVLNFANSMFKKLNYNPESNEIVLSVTTVCFDIFVFETFPTLLSGLQVFIANELEVNSPKLLNNIITNKKITKFLTTPSRVQLLFSKEKYQNCLTYLNEIILGGEPFPEILLKKLKRITKARLLNLYGPTETTVYSSFKDLTTSKSITIGTPIDNTQIYILNDNNKLLPVGKIGEICISGDGVGAGYYNNPERTKLNFVNNPYTNTITYKTGDLGYINKENEIVCLGRKDHQIKIRGYRIELDDISNNIMTFDGIEKCVVIDKNDKKNKKYLVAYFVAKKEINTIELRQYLADLLPNYMIPSYFMKLNSIPLTLNHKVDRKALPEPQKSDKLTDELIAPITETEKILYTTIKKELKLPKFGTNIDLFNFNIDSLDIIRIQTILLEKNIKLNTQDFYKYRTIQSIASFIDSNGTTEEKILDEVYLKNINNSFNKHINFAPFEKKYYNNILLIGSTGYLGMHLLYELINNTNSKIICIIRNKKDIPAEQRLQDLYRFYFRKKLPLDRVEIIDSDITRRYFGLLKSKYNELVENVDLVINTAANVRYYGNYEDFKKINVDVPEHLSDFCLEHHIKFIHISTLGVSGNYLINSEKNYNTFKEDDFFIGQRYTENVYIQTKFEAEMLLYKKASKGLDVSIIRVGNLTGRFEDGHFQKNIEENAFYNILRMILKYKVLPNTILNEFLEFTPIDLCAKAICLLLHNVNYSRYVFHLFNQNYLSAQNLIELLKELDINISVLSGNEFKNKILNLSKEYPEENILKGIVNDLDDTVGLTFASTVQQQNQETNFYLDKLNFAWPNIDKNYIEKIIDYMKKNKYI